jgi:hypothetical protein
MTSVKISRKIFQNFLISITLIVMALAESNNFKDFFETFMPGNNALIFSLSLSVFGIVGSFIDKSPYTKWIYGFCIGSLFFLSYGNMLLKSYNESMSRQYQILHIDLPPEPENKSNRNKCFSYDLDDPNRQNCFKSEDTAFASYQKKYSEWESKRDEIMEKNNQVKAKPSLETSMNFLLQLGGVSFISILLAFLNSRLSNALADNFQEKESPSLQAVVSFHQETVQSKPQTQQTKKGKGRPKKIDYEDLYSRIKPLRENGTPQQSICEMLGISKSAFYRTLKTFP